MKPVPQKWWTLFGVGLGVFMSTLDGGITNIALPALLRIFHSDFPTVQWVALSYLMVIASCTLVAARLGDLRGKKRMFALGIVLFTTGSVLCALAPGIRALALLRAFQATGAVLMGGLGMAIVTTAFPPEERGLALGFIGTTVSVGIALGPTLGGLILGLASWRWLFLVNLPVGIVAWLVVRRQVPDDPPAASGERFDIPGTLLMFLTLGAYTIGMTMGQRLGFDRPLVLVLLATGLVALIGFLAVERRVRAPMLDLTLFRNLPFALNLCMGFLIFVVMGGMFLLPFFLDLVLHLPPEKAGLLIATVPVSMGLVAPWAGALADRFGSRIISLVGLLVTVVACLLIATLHANVSTIGYILRLVPFGIGIGVFQSPNNRAIMHAAPHHRLGVASGLLALSRTLGMVTGMPLLGAIFALRVGAATHGGPAEISAAAPGEIVTGLAWTFRFAAVVLLVSSALAAAAWRADRGRRVDRPHSTRQPRARYHPPVGAGKRPGKGVTMNRPMMYSTRPAAARPVVLALVALVLALFVGPAGPAAAEKITILHSNDTHGHILPFSYPEGETGNGTLDSLKVRRDIGGMARRAALVREVRAECAAAGTTVRLIDAGDFCDGTPFSTEYHGEADLAAMNACGYNYGTFGNHEYNNPLPQVRKLAGMADDRILCANVVWKSSGQPLLCPFAVERIDSLTVGFFGLTTEEAGSYPGARDSLRVLPPIETAQAMVDTLRHHGADVIVLISHCGIQVDRALADKVPGICAIVGGHSHSRLPSGQFFAPFPDEPSDPGGTIVVQAHQWGGELGRLDLEFHKGAYGKWTMVRHAERLLPVTSALAPDPAVAAVVDRFWAPIAERYGKVIGTAEADFTSRGPDRAEYNLMADAIRETFGTELEMENLGGVRAPLVRGTITLANLVDLDPFNNTVVTYRITGTQLRAILLHHEPAVSGIRYRIENGDLKDVTVNGKPLEDAREYTGASNSYFAGRTLKNVVTWVDTGRPRLDVLVEYIQGKKTITPSYDGRRIVGNDDSE